MKNYNTPRKPNQEELDHLLGYCLVHDYGMNFPDIEEIQQLKGIISDASIAVFDNYITESPGYTGKLMLVVWAASECWYQAFTWDKDGEINLVEQGVEMSEKRSA
jgi:hypothetical protein